MDRPLKLLLTLLALLTGLSAVPAQARMCASDSGGIEQVEQGRSGGGSIAATVAEGKRQSAQRPWRGRELAKSRPAVRTVLIPSIQFGDRAHE